MLTEALFCTAVGIYFEARAESFYGQLLVANVIENRVNSRRYPNNHCDVLLQDRQFSFLNDITKNNKLEIKNKKAFITALTAAYHYNKYKPNFNNACHYATIETQNTWTLEYELVETTVGHAFYEGGCDDIIKKYANSIAKR